MDDNRKPNRLNETSPELAEKFEFRMIPNPTLGPDAARRERAEIFKEVDALTSAGMAAEAAVRAVADRRHLTSGAISQRYYRYRREVLGVGRPWENDAAPAPPSPPSQSARTSAPTVRYTTTIEVPESLFADPEFFALLRRHGLDLH
jgi:hypothetical protein